jgi:hypothetical protein
MTNMTLLLPAKYDTPLPRFATPRNPAFESRGWRVRRIARAMDTPLIGWQDQVIDVASEVDEHGRYRYHTIIVTVPRQSGKTTLVLANGVDRCMFLRGAKCWHTAQTGQDAREKFIEMADPFSKSTMGKISATLRRGAGATRLTFVNGSTFRPHPPTEESLHGQQSDLCDVDEGWSFDDTQGIALMQAITPTQATRRGAQTWITSTMGTADSTWFHGWCDKGRIVSAEGSGGIAYFEWSIGDDVDPADLEAVAAAHPAYGRLIDMQALEQAWDTMKDTPGAFARAYGNRRTTSAERIIPAAAWLRAQLDVPIPAGAAVVFGAATSWNRDETAIVAAAQLDDGRPIVEVIAVRPGTSWAVDAIEAASDNADRAPVVVDPVGPSGPLADALELRGVNVVRTKTADVTSGAADLFDRITATDDEGNPIRPRIAFRPDEHLNAAVDRASKRMVGDGAWTWGRRTSSGSIATLEAATNAARQAVRNVPAPAPYVYVGD